LEEHMSPQYYQVKVGNYDIDKDEIIDTEEEETDDEPVLESNDEPVM